MRVYTTLEEAASEIQRDIYKSPKVPSFSVQNIQISQEAHEALDYSYSVIEIPDSVEELFKLGVRLEMYDTREEDRITSWLIDERIARCIWKPGIVTEYDHPHLARLIGDNGDVDYTYTDRLAFGAHVLSEVLIADPTSRRAFWPIFQPEDSKKAMRHVRIPCSLGYSVLIRWVGQVPFLHLSYLERSCDFSRFWLSDIWFARQWQKEVFNRIKHQAKWDGIKDLQIGNTTHHIISFHAFIDQEVY